MVISLKKWFHRHATYPLILTLVLIVTSQGFFFSQMFRSYRKHQVAEVHQITETFSLAIDQQNRSLFEAELSSAVYRLQAKQVVLCHLQKVVIAYPPFGQSCAPPARTFFHYTVVVPTIGDPSYELMITLPTYPPLSLFLPSISISLLFVLVGIFMLGHIYYRIKYDLISAIGHGFEDDKQLSIRELETIRKQQNERRILLAKQEADSAVTAIALRLAHDVRSPLAALDSALGLMADHHQAAEQLIRSAASRVREIAERLLRENRKISDRPGAAVISRELTEVKQHEITDLISEIVMEKRFEYDGHGALEIVFTPSKDLSFPARVNRADFGALLSNLINNAVEAMNHVGIVYVQLSYDDEKFVKISIADTGKGIPKEVLAKLLKSRISFGKPSGNGLGLYQANQVIESWRGKMRISSEENAGTTVEIFLPVIAKEKVASSYASPSGAESRYVC